MPRRTTRGRMAGTLLCAVSALVVAAAASIAIAADPLGTAINQTQDANRASRVSQQRIDQLDDDTRKLFERYRSATAQSAQLGLYTQQLNALLAQQQAEQASLQRQLGDVDRTERELMPLMLAMLDSLAKFISLDLPFLKEERSERLTALQRMMSDTGVSVAEKYRRLLEAYQIEAQYGRTLGAERSGIEGRSVDVLRVGRLAMFALSSDGRDASLWDAQAKQWRPLQARWREDIAEGLRIARESATPQTLVLPVPAAPATGAAP